MVSELHDLLVGGQVQKVRQSDPFTLCLSVRTPGKTTHAVLSATPQAERFARRLDPGPTIDPPTALCSWVRSIAKGRRIGGLRLSPADRIVSLAFPDGALHLELIGARTNLLGVDADGRVVVAARELRSELVFGSAHAPPMSGPTQGTECQSRFGSAEEVESHFQAKLAAMIRDGAGWEMMRLEKSVRKRLRRLNGRVSADLERCKDADQLRQTGELLKGQMFRVEPKSTSVNLDNWYGDEGETVEVKLNPSLDAAGNVADIFRRYRRARDGAERAANRLREVVELSEKFEALCVAATDLEALQAGLKKLGLFRTMSRGPGQAQRLPYREFRSANGERILVGRGGEDNHQLTFKIGKGSDEWLHTRDSPGAHVIIPRVRRDRAPHPETLLDAVALAVHHSRLRGESGVSVMVTQRKYVSPVKGAGPGKVTVSSSRNVICPDVSGRILRLYRDS